MQVFLKPFIKALNKMHDEGTVLKSKSLKLSVLMFIPVMLQ